MGYIKGVASENVFATRYSNATKLSSGETIVRGIDQSADVKYQTTSGSTYVHHNPAQHASVSQTVGVHRDQDCYAKVSGE